MNDEIQPLSALERRILGVLVEKQKTSKTADTYPLTLNSLTTGCNQKSNRDPVLDLSEDDVADLLPVLQQKGLVCKVTGGRVDRWKHLLYEKWNVNASEMAILAELLLRGAQSVGDLRGRRNRMSPIATLDELQSLLKPLAERKLIHWLSDPERRGAMLTHGFLSPDELSDTQKQSQAHPVSESPRAAISTDTLSSVIADVTFLKSEVELLRKELSELKTELGQR